MRKNALSRTLQKALVLALIPTLNVISPDFRVLRTNLFCDHQDSLFRSGQIDPENFAKTGSRLIAVETEDGRMVAGENYRPATAAPSGTARPWSTDSPTRRQPRFLAQYEILFTRQS